MVMEKRRNFLRFLAYSLEIVILYILGSTPHLLPEIFGSKPVLLLPVALSIAVFESETVAMSFGFVCGVLTDIGYSNAIGTFAIGLTIVCFVLGFVAHNFIAANFYNVMLSSLVIITLLMCIHFLFLYIFAGYDDACMYFVNHYISRIVQTVLCTIPLYFLNKFVYSTLCE